jgi:lipopolysaccharide transport system permease protein
MGIYHPFAFLRCGIENWSLILRLTRRRIQSRYRGSMLGSLWTLLQPLLLLGVYTFVFANVLKSKWALPNGEQAPFALVIYAGMMLFSVFADSVNEAPTLMLANQVFIKQVRFPVEVLPWVSMLSSLFTFALNLMMLLLFYVVLRGAPPVTVWALPLLLPALILLTLGFTWFLSSAGLFLRDLSQVTGVATTALLFTSPIFYSATHIPEAFRPFFNLNPFSTIIESSHRVLFYGTLPDAAALSIVTAFGFGTAWLGYIAFMRMKKGFADVL